MLRTKENWIEFFRRNRRICFSSLYRDKRSFESELLLFNYSGEPDEGSRVTVSCIHCCSLFFTGEKWPIRVRRFGVTVSKKFFETRDLR